MTPQPRDWSMTGFAPPPSANKRTYSNHVLTKKYRSWRDDFGWRVRAARAPRFEGKVEVELILHEGRADADNRIKALLDALVTSYVIIDDSPKYVEKVTSRYAEPRVPFLRCMVIVRRVEAGRAE